ncbi:MAG: peptidoglycan recognition family protein [Armatimonadota bacterium]
MRTIDMIIVHQTDTPTGTLESVRRYHMQTLGWSDIGYHYLVTRDGKVHKGRANSEIGSHCKGDNATSIGVCCVGKGDALPVGTGYMNQAMWEALIRLVRQLMAAYHVPIGRVVGHRERPSGRAQGKTCPGFDVAVLRNLLRQEG